MPAAVPGCHPPRSRARRKRCRTFAENKIVLRHFARIAGRQEQEFSAFALVGTDVADIADVVEPEIVNKAQECRGAPSSGALMPGDQSA
jgi:hypothetical protein